MSLSTPNTAPKPYVIDVAAGALINSSGEILIAQRLPGKHMAGFWEFPGGKFESGETLAEALCRELEEELAISIEKWRPLITLVHHYPDRSVRLHVAVVSQWRGTPSSAEGQSLRWLRADQLHQADLLPADKPIANALQLPSYLAITPANADPEICDAQAVNVVGQNQTAQQQSYLAAGVESLQLLRSLDKSVALLPRSDIARIAYRRNNPKAKHQHLSAAELLRCNGVETAGWLSASVHSQRELEHAQNIGCDFVLLGSVLPTTSHPDGAGLGWDQFKRLASEATIPVYALGGLAVDDLEMAWHCGAQGIAGISGFLSGIR